MVKKIVFTIADDNNLKYAEMMEKSLRKFHSEEDLPLVVIKGDDLKARLTIDPMFFYRATPIIASELLKDYDVVIKIDADSIVTGDLSDAWKEPDIDMACVSSTICSFVPSFANTGASTT
jgi:lipopolysaccharide biosynthesis glycosyltransferase